MRVVHKDLKAAGIPYVDAKGEYADFHSLRKTFGTMLTLAGVPQRVVMELMRHSDMRLTAKTYADAGMLPTDATVDSLPSLNAAIPAPQIAPQSLVQTRPALSFAVRETEVPNFAETRMNTGFEGGLTLHVQPWPMPSKNGEKSGRQFEPESRPCIDEAGVGVTSHIASHEAKTKLEGWEVLSAWEGLPEALRAAILAIVRSAQREVSL